MANVTPIGSTSGAKALDAEWFAADLVPETDSIYASKFRIDYAISDVTQNIEYTLDSGITWVILAETADMAAEKTFQIFVAVRQGDAFNMRTKVVAGTTVRHCRVDEIHSEG